MSIQRKNLHKNVNAPKLSLSNVKSDLKQNLPAAVHRLILYMFSLGILIIITINLE